MTALKGNKKPCLKRDDFLKRMKLAEVSWTYSSANQPTGIISLFFRGSYICITSLRVADRIEGSRYRVWIWSLPRA